MTNYRSVAAAALLFVLASASGCKLNPFDNHSEKGQASWYGNEYHGRKTASGEVFNQWDNTAAHRKLPFGTVVLVKNMNNGKSLKVRINDRGPFVRGRIIDVSRGAADRLGMVRDGVVPVRIEVVRWGSRET